MCVAGPGIGPVTSGSSALRGPAPSLVKNTIYFHCRLSLLSAFRYAMRLLLRIK